MRKEVGDVTILVNNAGVAFAKKLLDQSVDEITRVIDVNLISHYWVSNIFEIHIHRNYEIHVYKIISNVTYIIFKNRDAR